MTRRIGLGLALMALASAAAWGIAWGVEESSVRSDLTQARAAATAGRLKEARPFLERVARRRPGWDEVHWLLGLCAADNGDYDTALAALMRVPLTSPYYGKATVLRLHVALDHGRYSASDGLPEPFLKASDPSADEARRTLGLVYRYEGRLDDVRRLIVDNVSRSPDPARSLFTLWILSHDPYPIDGAGRVLRKAELAAPHDDRVWLGLANLAIRLGDFSVARRRLDRCLERRPNDEPVWRARLNLALATDDVDGVVKSLPHLRAEVDQALVLRSWLAARRGDAKEECGALDERIARNPADVAALDRLAELALQAGEADRVASLRKRKEEVERVYTRYQSLLGQDDLGAFASDLGRCAEQLGLRFEARQWWTLSSRRNPRDPEPREVLARLSPESDPGPKAGLTLADLVAAPTSRATTPRASATPPPTEAPEFRDDAASAGLAFTFDQGRSPLRQAPETMSGGVAVLDYDGDGWLDVYAVQGGPFPPKADAPNADRLFRNRGNGTFEDASHSAGIDRLPGGYGHGVTVGDFDNDGRPDLFITRWHRYALLHNKGDGAFDDVTDSAGLGGPRGWPTSAAFADLDGDGDLDLYVCHYLHWNTENPHVCRKEDTGEAFYCDPRLFEADPDHLFRNDGGKFVDVTAEAGIADTTGRGLGVVIVDLDGDGKPDVFVANDMSANFLFRNLGGMKFEEVAHSAGVAANANGGYQAGMGIACGDLDGDGKPDLVVTNFYGESATFYRNLGGGLFADHTAAAGLAQPTRYKLGFGAAFLDADNDGHLDLALANGHVNDGRPFFAYDMPTQLLLGTVDGKLIEVTSRAGECWTKPRVGRGLAAADLDNDGKVDVIVLPQGTPLTYLHNTTGPLGKPPLGHQLVPSPLVGEGRGGGYPGPGHTSRPNKGRGTESVDPQSETMRPISGKPESGRFLTIQLEGAASGRDSVGARVTVHAASRPQTAWRLGGGSYQSSSDPRLHFGLGDAVRVDRVEVAWPSGQIDRYGGLATDRGYLLREGRSEAVPLRGFGKGH